MAIQFLDQEGGVSSSQGHPERSRSSGGVKDLPLNRPGVQAKRRHAELERVRT